MMVDDTSGLPGFNFSLLAEAGELNFSASFLVVELK